MARIQLNNKRGSIGITIVMMVFCFLMSVSMAYQKTVQTENMIRHNVSHTDRATDAAFAGVNYAMALIQSKRGSKITINNTESANVKSQWIYLDKNTCDNTEKSKFYYDKYYDDNKNGDNKKIPPYRFIVSCNGTGDENGNGASYYTDTATDIEYVLVKSYGEYTRYDDTTVVATYSAQLMAECEIDKTSGTVKLRRYRRMQPQITFNDDGTIKKSTNFYLFTKGNYDKDS